MQESLLHYIWQLQYFDYTDLKSVSGEPIQVLHPGYRNTHAGPDFSNARIRIGEIEWIGNVEIHISSSGWHDHKHHHDPAYENVIVHVVWENDLNVNRRDGSSIPTVELKTRVSQHLLLRYNNLVLNPETIPCASSILEVKELTRLSMFDRALMFRLESKAENVYQMLKLNHHDWEETTYQLLCRNFGFKINSDPFTMLAKSLPYKILRKHADKPLQVEALLFGQAGFLEDEHVDEYSQNLQREFSVLNRKFSLLERRLNKAQWKLLRLRPANFPTIRLAQLSSFIASQQNIYSAFISAEGYADLAALLNIETSEYWKNHYLFGRRVKGTVPSMGKMSIDNIIINTVIPLLVATGKMRDDQMFVDKAVSILQSVSSEENVIIKKWNTLGIKSKAAADSQGLLELYNNFCLRKRCLDCNIGSALIRPTPS
ncbi:MAG TPA: DUF2851 family protein [Chryseosolibacter sp.]|nr:DUF2851 family protein [Chryseosolibacter sp.]